MSSFTRLLVAAVAAAFCVATNAQDIPKTHLKVLGGFSNINFVNSIERPFWAKVIPEASKGAITADFTTLDQMGLQGTELLRLIRLGVLEFATGNVAYMSSDSPVFDGLDLPGILLEIGQARKATVAYKPVLSKIMAERYNAKLLMIWPNPPQVFYCRDKISGIADLKGKKVRAGSPSMADFIGGVGGIPVVLAFPDVVPALQRGTVDCGVTGTLSGNTAKWGEVTTSLYPLVLGWSPWFTAVSISAWNRMDPKARDLIENQMVALENQYWDNASKETQDGINCNTGIGSCVFGSKAKMNLVPISDGDKAVLARVANDVVVKKWADRCGKDCVRDWNNTVGAAIGFKID